MVRKSRYENFYKNCSPGSCEPGVKWAVGDGTFDRGEQSLGSDWLAQKVIGLDWFDDLTDCGKHDYRDSKKPFVGELRIAKSPSIEPRQYQVQQNQVG